MPSRNYNPLRKGKPLNRVSPKRFEPRGEWHPQVIRLDGPGMHELRDKVFKRSGGFCEGDKPNGKPCRKKITWFDFEMHHVIPRSKGGSDTEENCIALCREDHARIHGIPQWTLTAPEPKPKQTDFDPGEFE